MELQSAENLQVLKVLLELVHPQGGTVQIAQDSDNIQIQAADECSITEQLQNIQSVSGDLAGDGVVITLNRDDEGTLESFQNRFQISQLQLQEAKPQNDGSLEGRSEINTENVVFEIGKQQAEPVAIPLQSASSTTPQSAIVEIPILNTNKSPVKEKRTSPSVKTKKKKSIESLEAMYQYECLMCKKLCKSQHSLQKHMEKELRLKPHVCDSCGKRFKNLSGLQNHQKLHTGVKPYKCEKCDVAFTNRSTYNYHMEKQHMNKVFICQCSKTFKTKACLRAHLKNHTLQGPKRYKCQYCNLRLKTKHYKEEHERIHTDERPFKCRQGCDKAFRRSGARNDHERTVHLKVNKENCKYCGHLYDKREMKNHIMVHTGEKPFQCPYCESKYTQRKILNKHIRRKHPSREIPVPPPKKKVEKYINLQPEVIISKSPKKKKRKVKVQEKVKEVEKPAKKQEPAPTTIQIQVYKCMYCVKLFNDVNHLSQHEKTHVKESSYECSTCGKRFKRPEGLTRHEGKHAGGFRCFTCKKVFNTLTKLQLHTREHFFQCAFCKYKFQTAEKLEEHMTKHKKQVKATEFDGTKGPHECKMCKKTFLRKVGLKEHERIHLERIKCPLCDKVFVSYYLQKHLRTHSGDHPYTCSLCPNRHYTTANALRTHTRRRHPVQKIEIKHKKGSNKAEIKMHENMEPMTIANDIVVETDTQAHGDSGIASVGVVELAANLGVMTSDVPNVQSLSPSVIKNTSDELISAASSTSIQLPYLSNMINKAAETTIVNSPVASQAGPVRITQLVTQKNGQVTQLVTQENGQVTQIVSQEGIQVAQLVGQPGAQVMQFVNPNGEPVVQFHGQEEIQVSQMKREDNKQEEGSVGGTDTPADGQKPTEKDSEEQSSATQINIQEETENEVDSALPVSFETGQETSTIISKVDTGSVASASVSQIAQETSAINSEMETGSVAIPVSLSQTVQETSVINSQVNTGSVVPASLPETGQDSTTISEVNTCIIPVSLSVSEAAQETSAIVSDVDSVAPAANDASGIDGGVNLQNNGVDLQQETVIIKDMDLLI